MRWNRYRGVLGSALLVLLAGRGTVRHTDEEALMTEDAAVQRPQEPAGEQSDDARDQERVEGERAEDGALGVEPEGVMSDTTAIKEAGEIGRPATTMRA